MSRATNALKAPRFASSRSRSDLKIFLASAGTSSSLAKTVTSVKPSSDNFACISRGMLPSSRRYTNSESMFFKSASTSAAAIAFFKTDAMAIERLRT